ncbi:hypothetical protein chiPu_0027788 [Chiloscyllium punctatum]|uniref:Uncharacterized protein n=1 Tax=Chiloscyllium punctatum TaxID=137246 RepID=A0A401TM19_CHIPU|nr:hypothetical protein [Chiloscyllium punctatum]
MAQCRRQRRNFGGEGFPGAFSEPPSSKQEEHPNNLPIPRPFQFPDWLAAEAAGCGGPNLRTLFDPMSVSNPKPN